MKIKFLLSLFVAGTLAVGAQTQGYKDGIEYYKAGQHDNARTILERTINDPATDRSLANYYLGQVALVQGDKAQARTYFDAGLAADAECPFNYVGLGALALQEGNDEAAKEQFKQAQKFGKKNAEVSVSIARAYYNADPVKYDRDITKALEKARKDSKNADPSIYVLEGDMLAAAENFGDAAARYEMAITYDPNNPEGYVKFANAYFNVNKDFGINKLQEFLNAHPESAMAQRELAEKLFLADRWKAASELYGKYIQNPNHFPEDKARYAVLLYWGEDYPASLAIADEILASDPSNFLMQRVRFLDQTAMGQFQAAVENAEKFFASNPEANFTIKDYTTYADALSGIGQDSLAVVQYELAASKYPENGDLLKNLSTVYSRNRQYDKSAEAYDAYLKLQENPSLTDLYGMSGRYLNAAVYADSIRAKELAGRGIEYVNQVIDRAADVSPMMYQRLARLYVAANGKRPDADAIAAYDKMLQLLDQNPDNLNPANPNNALDEYSEAYAFEQAYASITGNQEGVEHWGKKYQEIRDLKNQQSAAPAQ
ncbi:MAG TPA: hypothetical protein DCE24_03920 [Porphyromonadaceae bacterium]|jgi:tetratricopeptide (TPR) repeat protein|nr:hypothetical protein [Porphyromonadaceae bacterium]